VGFLKKLTGWAYGTRYFDVVFKLPKETYTKDAANKYMNKALLIIEL
jgi:HEPN domain-containing protein